MLITIREQDSPDDANAVLRLDQGPEFPVTISDPFSDDEEERLEWYFEKHLRRPFVDQVRAERAAESVEGYGEALFDQVFDDPDAYARYREAYNEHGVDTLRFEIEGSPEFHGLHWETLKDPDHPRSFSLDCPVVRKSRKAPVADARPQESPTINVLVVTARPHREQDVSYRTISRPLVEGLRETDTRVRVDLVRPGTFEALSQHLEAARDEHGTSFYHVVHFDVHGALLSYDELEHGIETDQFLYRQRFGRDEIEPYDGVKGFLFLEGDEPGQPDPVVAGEVAELLQLHGVPIAILNACQSGKQVGATETSLGSRLLDAGVQMVLAMSYSVTVTAARRMMQTLYDHLFSERSLSAAVRRARLTLHNEKDRQAYFDQTVELEDWMLPVVYQNRDVELNTRDFVDADEEQAFYERRAAAYDRPNPEYGFVGRDLDVLHVERRVLDHNLLLVRGMGGAGKTTLLQHLGWWWQRTNFVDEVFEFAFDEKPWTADQIFHRVGQVLYDPGERDRFQSLPHEVQREKLAGTLRARRHLILLDNTESITGGEMAVGRPLDPDERTRLRRFLNELAGGKTVVLLGSRNPETWLTDPDDGRAPLTEDHVYPLSGLDPEAASTLAERILEAHDATEHRTDDDFQRLLGVLDGYPTALEVVLPNLADEAPEDVLAALQEGDMALDQPDAADRTESLLQCVRYSYDHLPEDTQGLLLCLAPFTSVINLAALDKYVERLRDQAVLQDFPFDQLENAVQQAVRWGLLGPHEVQGFLGVQPLLPYFLRNELEKHPEQKAAIDKAYRAHYEEYAGVISNAQDSNDPDEQKTGRALADLEYENLRRALRLALDADMSILSIYPVLSAHFDDTQDHRRGLAFGQDLLDRLQESDREAEPGRRTREVAAVTDDIANYHLHLKDLDAAEDTYQRALDVVESLDEEEQGLGTSRASIYQQLGVVAGERRDFEAAADYFQEALEIFQELSNRPGQARTHHNLGRIAEGQRDFEVAADHYQKALDLKKEISDRHGQADTYHELGRVAEEQREFEAAADYYQRALDLRKEFDDRHGQAKTNHQLGMVAQKQRKFEAAAEYYQEALDIFQDYGDRHRQASTYHNLGAVAGKQRDFEAAEGYLQKALDLRKEFGDRHGQAETYHQLGVVAREQREFEVAEDYLQKALDLKTDFGNRHDQASTYHQLGQVAEEQRDFHAAEDYYQKTLNLYQEFGDRHGQASTYHQLGVVAEEQREFEEARNYYETALTIYVAFDDQHRGMIVLSSLARLWDTTGDDAIPALVAEVFEDVDQAEAEDILCELLDEDASAHE